MPSDPKATCLNKLKTFFDSILTLSPADLAEMQLRFGLYEKYGRPDDDNDSLDTLRLTINTKFPMKFLPTNVRPVINNLNELFSSIMSCFKGKKEIGGDELVAFIVDELMPLLDIKILTPALFSTFNALECTCPQGVDPIKLNSIKMGMMSVIEKTPSSNFEQIQKQQEDALQTTMELLQLSKIDMLKQECERYRIHLKTEVEALQKNCNIIKLKNADKTQAENDPINIPEEWLSEFSLVDRLTIQKFNTVNKLLIHLNNPKLNSSEKIIRFYSTFQSQKPILEKRRDRALITFLKGVGSVLSFGLAVPFLWRVQGKNFASNVNSIFAEKILEQKPSSVEIQSLRAGIVA